MRKNKTIVTVGIIAMLFMAPMAFIDTDESDAGSIWVNSFEHLKECLQNGQWTEITTNTPIIVPEGEPISVNSGVTLEIGHACPLTLYSTLTVQNGAILKTNVYTNYDSGRSEINILGPAACIIEQGGAMKFTNGPKVWNPTTFDIIGSTGYYSMCMSGCTDARIVFNGEHGADVTINGGRMSIFGPNGDHAEFIIRINDSLTASNSAEIVMYHPVIVEGDVTIDEGSELIVCNGGSINTADEMKGDPSLTVNGTMLIDFATPIILKSRGVSDGSGGNGFALNINGKVTNYGDLNFGTCSGEIASPATMIVNGTMVQYSTMTNDGDMVINGSLINNKYMVINGTMTNDGKTDNNSNIIVNGAVINNGAMMNDGTIECEVGGSVTSAGDIENDGAIVNYGSVMISGEITGGGKSINYNIWSGNKPDNYIENGKTIETESAGTKPVTDGTMIESTMSAVSFVPSGIGAAGDVVTVKTAGGMSAAIDAGGLVDGVPVIVVITESENTSKLGGRVYVADIIGVMPGTPLTITLPASFADSKVYHVVNGVNQKEITVAGNTPTTVTFNVVHNSEFVVVGVADTVKGTAHKVTIGSGVGFIIDNRTGPNTPAGTFEFSVVPVDGYKVAKVDVSNGTLVGNGSEYTLSNVTADTVIYVAAFDDTADLIIGGVVALIIVTGLVATMMFWKKS